MINQKDKPASLRVRKLLANLSILDDFQVYSSKLEYIPILADLVSLTFHVKVNLYTYSTSSFAGKRLECSFFANKNEKVISVFRSLDNHFISLIDVSEMSQANLDELLSKQKINVSSYQETTSCNEIVNNMVENLLTNEEEIVVPNVFLIEKEDQDQKSVSEISILENHSDCKSNSSLELLDVQKKFSDDSNQDTNDSSYSRNNEEKSLDMSDLSNKKSRNLLSYEENDEGLNKIFSGEYKPKFNQPKFVPFAHEMFSSFNNTPSKEDTQICFTEQNSQYYGYNQNQFMTTAAYNTSEKVKREIIDLSDRRFTGLLKFYNENKGFGFVECEQDGTEIFLHGDDLLKANIDLKVLKKKLNSGLIRFSFSILEYMGKYKRSRKIVDLKLIEIN